MTMTGPAELKDRMVALWASHAEWMKASHHRGGDKACLFYHQCISEEMNDFTKGRPELGAGAEPTGCSCCVNHGGKPPRCGGGCRGGACCGCVCCGICCCCCCCGGACRIGMR